MEEKDYLSGRGRNSQLTEQAKSTSPASLRSAAQKTPRVASSSACLLRRLLTACHSNVQPLSSTLPRAISRWACMVTRRRRAVPAQYRMTAKLSPTILARTGPGRESNMRSPRRHPTASATCAVAGHGMAATAVARRRGGPPSRQCCQRDAPAPATLDSPISRAPPSKVTSKGQLASSHSGEGLESTVTSDLDSSSTRAISDAQ